MGLFQRRQNLIIVPAAILFFIFGSLYSSRSWTGVPQPRLSHNIEAESTHHSQQGEREDPNCAAFPRERLEDIQVVLRIGSTQPYDQISSHINNITNCISNLIIISDREEQIGDRFWAYDIIADLPKVYWEGLDSGDGGDDDPTAGLKAYTNIRNGDSSWKAWTHVASQLTHQEGWSLDRFKFLPMVEYAYKENRDAKWFFFVEADTYIVWDTLFRLVDRFDPEQPWYMGSPAPGREMEDGYKTWFAYGGDGFILSRPAIERLVHRDTTLDEEGNINSTAPSVTEKWADLVKSDCCGDSVLGFALATIGIFLSGMYPLFNPHSLHGIPFGPSGKPYWCQPVLSLHKTHTGDVPMLSQFLRDRSNERPLIYADLYKYLSISSVAERADWINSDWGGFEEAPESPVHENMDACAEGCHAHGECYQWTYFSEKSTWDPPRRQCTFVRSIRLGSHKDRESTWSTKANWTSGWDLAKITQWADENPCEEPEWVEPSLERVF